MQSRNRLLAGTAPTTRAPERSHHLDKRAHKLASALESAGDEDHHFTTARLAIFLDVSTQWLEIARSKGYGPPFTRITPRMVRYRRNDVLDWLRERTFRSTSEYPTDERKAG